MKYNYELLYRPLQPLLSPRPGPVRPFDGRGRDPDGAAHPHRALQDGRGAGRKALTAGGKVRTVRSLLVASSLI